MNRTEAREIVSLAVTHSGEYFVRNVLGDDPRFGRYGPYSKQVDIMNAVRDYPRVAVVGCNGSGKDYTSGQLILWWLHRYDEAKVFVYGPTHRQVQRIVFNETRAALRRAPSIDGYTLQGQMYNSPRYDITPSSFAEGFATTDPFNIQGWHSPHLLVIVTEAHGLQSSHFEALEGLQPECILMTGNPLVNAGDFYDAFHTKREDWRTIEIGAWDTPNLIERAEVIPGMISIDDVERAIELWGVDSPIFIARIEGKFPPNLEGGIVPTYYAQQAVNLVTKAKKSDPIILAVDVARGGEDKTVIARRRGKLIKLIWKYHGSDTMKIVGWLGEYVRNHTVDVLTIDAVGVGGPVYDRLREVMSQEPFVGKHIKLVEFQGGNRPHDTDRFINRNAEAWWTMREAFLAGNASIDNDPALISQLPRVYHIQSDAKIRLEEKAKMHKSPDEGDAVAMTFDHWVVSPRGTVWV